MILTASYHDDSIYACFEATGIKTDFGVPGSPTWLEVDDPAITSISILDVELDPKTLPTALYDKILELVEDDDWES